MLLQKCPVYDRNFDSRFLRWYFIQLEKIMKVVLKKFVAATLLAVGATAVQAAPAVLDTGSVQMGISDFAGLGEGGVGLVGPTGDAITPGCLCEGWGASAGGSAGYTYGGSRSGLTSGTTTATVLSGPTLAASSIVSMSNGLEVTHTYSYAAGGVLFKVHVAMKNATAGSLSDVRYARTLDWDVPPGHFSDDFTTVRFSGIGGKLFSTSTDPFAVPDPLVTRSQDQDINITDTPGDKGSFFIFKFGDLAAGEMTEFDTYIGAGRTTKELVDALNGVGAEAYSYTFDNDTPATYGYGFVGIGLPPVEHVPEPGTLALASLALLGLGGMRRRKSA